MEEEKNPPVGGEEITPQKPAEGVAEAKSKEDSAPKKESSGKLFKVFVGICIALGLLVFVGGISSAYILKKIDPIKQLTTAQLASCAKDECANSKDPECINKCMAKHGMGAEVTPIKVTPTLIPTAKPTAAVIKKITYAPTVTPTPAGSPTLVIRVSPDTNSVTLVNQTTGKTTTEAISTPGKNYYVDPGSYRITVNEKANFKAAYSICYSNCTLTSGDWGSDDWGSTVNVNVEKGKTSGVDFYYIDPNNLPWHCTGGSTKPFCL